MWTWKQEVYFEKWEMLWRRRDAGSFTGSPVMWCLPMRTESSLRARSAVKTEYQRNHGKSWEDDQKLSVRAGVKGGETQRHIEANWGKTENSHHSYGVQGVGLSRSNQSQVFQFADSWLRAQKRGRTREQRSPVIQQLSPSLPYTETKGPSHG